MKKYNKNLHMILPDGGDRATHNFLHAMRRACERYDIDFTFQTEMDINTQIAEGDAELVAIENEIASLYHVFLEGKKCLVVFDMKDRRVITFLPLSGSAYLAAPKHVEDSPVSLKGRRHKPHWVNS